MEILYLYGVDTDVSMLILFPSLPLSVFLSLLYAVLYLLYFMNSAIFFANIFNSSVADTSPSTMNALMINGVSSMELRGIQYLWFLEWERFLEKSWSITLMIGMRLLSAAMMKEHTVSEDTTIGVSWEPAMKDMEM